MTERSEMNTVGIAGIRDHVDEEVVVRGWLHNKRSSGMAHTSFSFTTCEIACESRSQFAASCRRYRRPGRVSE